MSLKTKIATVAAFSATLLVPSLAFAQQAAAASNKFDVNAVIAQAKAYKAK